jgi:hypothetical protein
MQFRLVALAAAAFAAGAMVDGAPAGVGDESPFTVPGDKAFTIDSTVLSAGGAVLTAKGSGSTTCNGDWVCPSFLDEACMTDEAEAEYTVLNTCTGFCSDYEKSHSGACASAVVTRDTECKKNVDGLDCMGQADCFWESNTAGSLAEDVNACSAITDMQVCMSAPACAPVMDLENAEMVCLSICDAVAVHSNLCSYEYCQVDNYNNPVVEYTTGQAMDNFAEPVSDLCGVQVPPAEYDPNAAFEPESFADYDPDDFKKYANCYNMPFTNCSSELKSDSPDLVDGCAFKNYTITKCKGAGCGMYNGDAAQCNAQPHCEVQMIISPRCEPPRIHAIKTVDEALTAPGAGTCKYNANAVRDAVYASEFPSGYHWLSRTTGDADAPVEDTLYDFDDGFDDYGNFGEPETQVLDDIVTEDFSASVFCKSQPEASCEDSRDFFGTQICEFTDIYARCQVNTTKLQPEIERLQALLDAQFAGPITGADGFEPEAEFGSGVPGDQEPESDPFDYAAIIEQLDAFNYIDCSNQVHPNKDSCESDTTGYCIWERDYVDSNEIPEKDFQCAARTMSQEEECARSEDSYDCEGMGFCKYVPAKEPETPPPVPAPTVGLLDPIDGGTQPVPAPTFGVPEIVDTIKDSADAAVAILSRRGSNAAGIQERKLFDRTCSTATQMGDCLTLGAGTSYQCSWALTTMTDCVAAEEPTASYPNLQCGELASNEAACRFHEGACVWKDFVQAYHCVPRESWSGCTEITNGKSCSGKSECQPMDVTSAGFCQEPSFPHAWINCGDGSFDPSDSGSPAGGELEPESSFVPNPDDFPCVYDGTGSQLGSPLTAEERLAMRCERNPYELDQYTGADNCYEKNGAYFSMVFSPLGTEMFETNNAGGRTVCTEKFDVDNAETCQCLSARFARNSRNLNAGEDGAEECAEQAQHLDSHENAYAYLQLDVDQEAACASIPLEDACNARPSLAGDRMCMWAKPVKVRVCKGTQESLKAVIDNGFLSTVDECAVGQMPSGELAGYCPTDVLDESTKQPKCVIEMIRGADTIEEAASGEETGRCMAYNKCAFGQYSTENACNSQPECTWNSLMYECVADLTPYLPVANPEEECGAPGKFWNCDAQVDHDGNPACELAQSVQMGTCEDLSVGSGSCNQDQFKDESGGVAASCFDPENEDSMLAMIAARRGACNSIGGCTFNEVGGPAQACIPKDLCAISGKAECAGTDDDKVVKQCLVAKAGTDYDDCNNVRGGTTEVCVNNPEYDVDEDADEEADTTCAQKTMESCHAAGCAWYEMSSYSAYQEDELISDPLGYTRSGVCRKAAGGACGTETANFNQYSCEDNFECLWQPICPGCTFGRCVQNPE